MSTTPHARPPAPAADADEPDAGRTLRFERRREDRWPVEGVATAFRLAGVRFGEAHTLRMLDYSPGGLGARCEDPVEPGTLLSIGFREPGYLARRGVALRCHPSGDGYRVAIQFESCLAA